MRFVRPLQGVLLCLFAGLVFGCGKDSPGITTPKPTDPDTVTTPPPPPAPPAPNFVKLASDPGDYIGGGRSYEYSQANSILTVTAQGGLIRVAVSGDEGWNADFQLPAGMSAVQTGSYTGLGRFPFHDPARGGIDWTGEGRGCNQISGSFTVDSVTYASGALATLDLRFEQHCEGAAPALRGSIHWRADDQSGPAPPVDPVPAGLWQPPTASLPASGNYIYLQSDPGDYIGGGQSHTYTPSDFIIGVTSNGAHLTVSVDGWSGDFQAMLPLDQLRPGYYGGLRRFPFHNPAKGGLSWSGNGRGCNTLTGWFAVDGVTYSGTALETLDLRFEQHCEGGATALRGRIHWRADDKTQPAGPVNPPPAGLWQPPAASLPASGNYVYLQSDPGDYIGQGQTQLYTPHDFILTATASGGHAQVLVGGWTGDFQAMNTLTQLQPGYYGNLGRYPFHNPARGGLSWSGNGRGCNTLTGWFVVDSVTYAGGAMTALDLRFEQHCEGGGPALHGAVHWRADDKTTPGGPVNPPPAGLWQPPTATLPASGNYVFLQSDPGDYIGGGQTYTYTPRDFFITVSASGGHTAVSVDGWSGDFQAMYTLGELKPGYYGDLSRYPFHNPAKGGLSWSGKGRGCNTLTGWFVVDNVTYAGGAMTALDLRFEQHCEGMAAALRGAVHWRADDTTQPGGPVNPPPAGLWQPPTAKLPASGNYVYLQSDPGDFVGGGQTYTYTPRDFFITVSATGGHVQVKVDVWTGEFQAMSTLSQLQPGYYGDLSRYPFHNPAKGGLAWFAGGCNALNGWFVVDNVTYSGGAMTALDLRFEQHCEGMAPALHGAIHWRADDTTLPPGPVNPPPAGLWQPPTASLPASGNYIYLQSDPGDYIGEGKTYTYTPHDFFITMTANGGRAEVKVDEWSGNFQAMATLSQLQPGYYGDLRRYPFHNPAKGGLEWHGQGRGCNMLIGWFVVDQVTYSGGVMTALDLRFEQHCEGRSPALRGAIHWRADDTTQPAGPVNPPPAGLWQPPAGSLPATGNYVYLQSDPGDFIGEGKTYTYASAATTINMAANDGHATVTVDGWWGDFQAMATISQLQPGYYGDLRRYPFHNPAKGGLSWYGQGRGCNTLTGWFVVDQVTYSGGTLTALDLRFEQHCEGGPSALRGAVHWRA